MKDKMLYLVTDQAACLGKDFYESVEAAVRGGASVVQLREKNLDTRDFYLRALKLKDICNRYGARLIINDRLDIAQAVDADGVHLGQSDMPIKIARKILGYNKIIGITTKTLNQALEAEKEGADYIGVGAFFKSPSKPDAILIDREELKKIIENVRIEKYGIGGINLDNVDEILPYGLDGVCVIADILSSDDCQNRSRLILEKMNNRK